MTLQWPAGRPRTPEGSRKQAAFNKKRPSGRGWDQSEKLSVGDAIRRLQSEIDRLKATDYVLSSNLSLRLDGMPRADQGNPKDPGVALYFTLRGEPVCLPCDTYTRAADNIAALAKHIEATRAIERYGVATVKEMFAGFAALPSPRSRTWRDVFGWAAAAPAVPDAIEFAYRRLAKSRHPDHGGTPDGMAELNEAREAALREARGG